MKLKDLTESQVVQTTEENHEAFMKLLDKEGLKWSGGVSTYVSKSASNNYDKDILYNVRNGLWCDKDYYLRNGYEIIPASKFLKPTKKELLERIEKLEEVVNQQTQYKIFIENDSPLAGAKFNINNKPTVPKVGDLCAFVDRERMYESNQYYIGVLEDIDETKEFKYKAKDTPRWRYARKVEIKFL